MMFDEINRKFRLLQRVRPLATLPEEGVTIGLKVSVEIRKRLQAIQARYGLSTYREVVMVCLLIGVETLQPRPENEDREILEKARTALGGK